MLLTIKIIVCFIIIFFPLSVYSADVDSKLDKAILRDYGVSIRGIYSTPAVDLRNVLNPALGGEFVLLFRRFLIDNFRLEIVGNYSNYTGKIDNSNTLQIITGKLLGRYDIYMDIIGISNTSFYVELGGGIASETLKMGELILNTIDPIYHIGIGIETQLYYGLTLNGLMSYSFIYQEHIAEAIRNGSFINFGIGISYWIQNKER